MSQIARLVSPSRKVQERDKERCTSVVRGGRFSVPLGGEGELVHLVRSGHTKEKSVLQVMRGGHFILQRVDRLKR